VSIEVSLDEVVEELGFVDDEFNVFLNKVTSELVGLANEHLRLAEDMEGPEDLEGCPDWQKDVIAEAIAVQFSGEFVKLPTKYDIHEY
jgi:hypothetical protein